MVVLPKSYVGVDVLDSTVTDTSEPVDVSATTRLEEMEE